MIETLIIGPGRMGRNYAHVLKNDPRVKILGVCGNSAEKTNQLASELGVAGISEKKYVEAFKLFSPGAKKLVVITTSEWEHLLPLTYSLEIGAAIILEKPILGNFSEFKQIKDALLKHPAPILPCFTSRFDPRYFDAQQIVEHHKIQPLSIYSRRNTDHVTASRVQGKIAWPYWIVGHDIDLIRWFSRQEIKSVKALNRFPGKIDRPKDFLHVELTLENGTKGFIESSWFLPPLAGPALLSEFRILSEEGCIEIPFPPRNYSVTQDKFTESYPDDFLLQAGRAVGNTPNMIQHFVDVVDGKAKPILKLEDGIRSLQVSEAITRSILQKCEVELAELENL
jgi:predicted dehydrogenase